MATEQGPEANKQRKRTLINFLIICVCCSSLLTFLLIPLADNSTRLNARQVFDSSRWHSLQLQLQTYRLMNYLSDLSADDLPVNGNAYFQYDLVLSRVDLLRKGDLGRHIRNFANGRATRLLNIISGELELISLNIEHLENGRLDQVPIIMERLRSLDSQITDFVVIVNQGANDYVTKKRAELDVQLECIQFISLILLGISAALLFMTFKLSQVFRQSLNRTARLEQRIEDILNSKVDVISRITSELKPAITSIISRLSYLKQDSAKESTQVALERVTNHNSQILTLLDGYHDLILIEANKLKPHISEGAIRDHLEYTIQALEPTFSAHNVRVICQVDPRIPSLVDTDYKRLHEILTVLLLQITPLCVDAELMLNIRPSTLPILRVPEKHNDKAIKMVQISLKDTGEGLPEAIQSGLRSNPFNPTNTVANQIQQMGLGFTLCHLLIGSLDGELHFSTTQGKGSEIWIDLPMGVNAFANQAGADNITESIAVLSSDTFLDQGLEALLASSYQVQLLSEEQLTMLVLNSADVSFSWLLISDKTTLSSLQLEYLKQLQRQSVNIIWCASLARKYPEFHAEAVYHYPITASQLAALLRSQD